MRKLFYLIPFVILSLLLAISLPEDASSTSAKKKSKYTKQQRIDGAIEDRIFTSSDVDLGHIPYNKLFAAIEEGHRRVAAIANQRNFGGSLADAEWRERGPNNIGGRTRSIMIDESDPSRNRIWIGGVSGGLWRTEDITQSDPQWMKLGIYFESTSIGDIAQDPTDHRTVYVGTGESYTGDFQGVGIFKTTDDGETWTLIQSTRNSNFQYVNEIYVHTNADVYAATASGGLFRSQDKGETWEKVLGTSLSGASNNEFHDILFNETNQTFYTSNDNSIFKSTTGGRGEWQSIGTSKPGFPTNLKRVEMAVCPSDPDVIYVLGADEFNAATNTYVSNNGGETWASRSAPGEPGSDFTNGQGWYDLEIAVDPANCARIIAGGVPMYESSFQGFTWQPIAQGEIHVDHHFIYFDHKKPGRVLYGNDGGVWLSNNAGHNITSKNTGYVTTQFYCAAIHPDKGSPYAIGGTQDNNSLQIEELGLSPANSVWGGDGVFCFIDQNEPDTQIVSSQFGNYGLSLDGGKDFGFGAEVNGSFINRSGYDDDANILYGQINTSGFFRWKIPDFVEEVDIQGLPIDVSAVKADPNVDNRMYFGGQSGRVIKVDNAHEGTLVEGELIADFPGNASVSSIYLDRSNSDHMLVSLFNYGANLDNIFVTYNAGSDWASIEGDLPDIPVRWAIFDPADHDRVMIATDAGIWTTDDVDGANTHWVPTNPDNGMPFVRVDMLLVRESDKVVLAATHGRGLLTTDVFSSPSPVIVTQPIAYEGQEILIDGSNSVNASSFEWNMGDNTTSSEAKFSHTYNAPGNYTISLTINGVVTDTRNISILPYLPAPYQIGSINYTGDFETHPEHFASYTLNGTSFQRGISNKGGKDGTHSGTSAWVTGINDNLYLPNTRAELYTPQYDMSESGLYGLKFWAKYLIQNRNDGFQVEYSKDGGASWFQLGSKEDPSWYNYHNLQINDGAFPVGKSYFTNEQTAWTPYNLDISFLGGESRVSFRFVFRSDADEELRGLALDDFEVTKYEGELRTLVTVFEGSHLTPQRVLLNWTTGVEFNAKKFIIERSLNGFKFDTIATINATGDISTEAQNYSYEDPIANSVIYYRLRVINDNPNTNYHLEFLTETIVVRKIASDIVHTVLTNPFTDRIRVSFSSIIDEEVSVKLFDMSGKMVVNDKVVPNNVAIEVGNLNFPPGVYVLYVQIGENEAKAYKLLSLGR